MVNESDTNEVYSELCEHHFGVVVEVVEGTHCGVHGEIPECVHGTNVVQHIWIVNNLNQIKNCNLSVLEKK